MSLQREIKHRVGLHLRHSGSLEHLAARARDLKLTSFQCFLTRQNSHKLIMPSDEEINQFIALREKYFTHLYAHGSYWINLADQSGGGVRACERELACAKRLGFTHLVVHPGSARGVRTKKEGIEHIARSLERILLQEHAVNIVLENTAHGGMSIGGDLHDFQYLRSCLGNPEKLLFCIDTSHAHAYGYDISSVAAQNAFLAILEETVSLSSLVLIHLNDTTEPLGSRIDRHSAVGEGCIGESALQTFALHPLLASVPLILELPAVSLEQEEEALNRVRNWFK